MTKPENKDSRIKTLYLDGKVICDYESTGDFEKDLELTREILKEKGVYKKSSPVDAMHRQANSFANTAKNLYENGLVEVPRKLFNIAPFVVNAAFSIEMYLKTIHKVYGNNVRGHHLTEIYDKLHNDAKSIILASSNDCKTLYNLENENDIKTDLDSLNKTFEQWRYLYEHEKLYVEVQTIRYVMHSMHEACCRTRKHK